MDTSKKNLLEGWLWGQVETALTNLFMERIMFIMTFTGFRSNLDKQYIKSRLCECLPKSFCFILNKNVTTRVLTKHLFIRLERWRKMYTGGWQTFFFHIPVYLNVHSAIFIYHIKTKSFTKNYDSKPGAKNRGSYNGINMFK